MTLYRDLRSLRAVITVAAFLALLITPTGANANNPPGSGTAIFSPSGNGGCKEGQISALPESQSSPTNIFGGGSNYSWGMASDTFHQYVGYPSPATVLYFTNSCNVHQILGGCYMENGSICPGWSSVPGLVYSTGSNDIGVGPGIAYDGENLYWATQSSCSDYCKSNLIYKAPASGTLSSSPQQIYSLSKQSELRYMAVDPVTDTLFWMPSGNNQIWAAPASGGGSPQMILSNTSSLISGGISGLAVDPTTATVYFASAQMGDEPNRISQMSESGANASSLYTGGAVGNSSTPMALAIDPDAGIAVWALTPAGKGGPSGDANMLAWGPLEGGSQQTTYGWTGAPGADYAAYVWGLTIALESNSMAGSTAQSVSVPSSGKVAIPVSCWVPKQNSTAPSPVSSAAFPSAASATPRRCKGTLTAMVRAHLAKGASRKTYKTIKIPFSLAANKHDKVRAKLGRGVRKLLKRRKLDIRLRTSVRRRGRKAHTRVRTVPLRLKRKRGKKKTTDHPPIGQSA